MNLDEFQKYCESFNGGVGEFPFDEETLEYKVCAKIFALTNFQDFQNISLKCDPHDARAYREIYEAVIPGYLLNKLNWNPY